MIYKILPASKIAKILYPPPPTDLKTLIFGKVFEEVYTFNTYLYEKSWAFAKFRTKYFARVLARAMKERGIYSRDLLLFGIRLRSALLKAGVTGQKPKTEFKFIDGEGVCIAAQPDLTDFFNYHEFTIGELNNYQVEKTKIMAFVVGEPINLWYVKSSEGFVEVDCLKVEPLPETSQEVKKWIEIVKEHGEEEEFYDDDVLYWEDEGAMRGEDEDEDEESVEWSEENKKHTKSKQPKLISPEEKAERYKRKYIHYWKKYGLCGE